MMETRLKAYRGAMVAALYAALTLGLAPAKLRCGPSAGLRIHDTPCLL